MLSAAALARGLRAIANTSSQQQQIIARGYVPMVIEQTRGGGERAYDIFSRLLKERIGEG
jgi:hypothetical protein